MLSSWRRARVFPWLSRLLPYNIHHLRFRSLRLLSPRRWLALFRIVSVRSSRRHLLVISSAEQARIPTCASVPEPRRRPPFRRPDLRDRGELQKLYVSEVRPGERRLLDPGQARRSVWAEPTSAIGTVGRNDLPREVLRQPRDREAAGEFAYR